MIKISFDFKDIDLAAKPIFDKYFTAKTYLGSECSFANLFAWRRCYQLKWTETDNCLLINVCRNGVNFFLPPFPEATGNVNQGLPVLFEFMEQNPDYEIRGIYKDIKEQIAPEFLTRLDMTDDRDNFDYVYERQALATLAGRKYHAKKNHVNAFKKLYPDYKYVELTEELIPDCKEFLARWFTDKGILHDRSIRCEMSALNQTFHNFNALNLRGAAIMIDGRMEAFSYGEKLNSQVAVIHVEKANPNIRGLYATINKDFCENAWQDVEYINREEDMGIEGLRKAKESYNPAFLLEKYSARLKR